MRFIVKRLLWCIPTLLAIVMVGFILQVYTPGDPVNTILGIAANDDPLKPASLHTEKQRKDWENKLGLNLPLFNISIQSGVLPDTLYRVTDKKEKKIIYNLCLRTGQTAMVMHLRQALHSLKKTWIAEVHALSPVKRDSLSEHIAQMSHTIQMLENESTPLKIQEYVGLLKVLTSSPAFSKSNSILHQIEKEVHLQAGTSIKTWLPSIRFYSTSRFQHWLLGDGKYSKGIIRGDFGISYITKEPIRKHIYTHLFWSVLFSGMGILLAYLISIPIGIRSAMHHNSIGEKITSFVLFALYCIPVFFLGTLLQTFLANHQYLHIFEPTGVQPTRGFTPGSNLLQRIWQSLPYMVLPIICFTYSSIAFLTKLTKTSILDILNQPYITTAKAKGLSKQRVIYQHAFKNALIPLITVFANIFPVLVGGSVIIESIFTIPGMGTEMFKSYFSHNIPVIISIFTLTGIFTVLGFLISDILYVLVDPRIRK
jgi:peptide/nickel transport system permease protein